MSSCRLGIPVILLAAIASAYALDSLPEPITGPVEVERIYFIDPVDGDDDADGLSRENAWRSLAMANATLRPGEGVTLLAGVYLDERIAPERSGEEGRPILYQGEPGAILRAAGVRSDAPVRVDGIISIAQDWIVVQDLELNGNRWELEPGETISCATIEGDHNVLRRLEMHNAPGAAIWMHGEGSLIPGEEAPAFYEAEALAFHVAWPDGSWGRPIMPDRGGEAVIQTLTETWRPEPTLTRQTSFTMENVPGWLSRPLAEDGTWRQQMPLRLEEPGEVYIALLGRAPEGANVSLEIDGERLPVPLEPQFTWSASVRLDLDAGRSMAEIVIDAPGVVLDQVAVARSEPELSGSEPRMPLEKFHYTTSHNIIEQCQIYYCGRLEGWRGSDGPGNRVSAIIPSKCGVGNVIRLNRVHHIGADAIQPRRGSDGLLIEWNELYGAPEESVDLKAITGAVVRYNLMHSNRSRGMVSHDGHHPDPPMYASGHRIYGNVIANVPGGIQINDAMAVYGDERDTIAVHDNLIVTEGRFALDINWSRVPVRVERNVLVGPSRVLSLGGRHHGVTPEGWSARRFNAEVVVRDNVIHATGEAPPLIASNLRHPEDDLAWLGPNLFSPDDAGQLLHVIRGPSFDVLSPPPGWLQFAAPEAELVHHPEDVTLKGHSGGFMVFESNQPGSWLEMPFALHEPITGELYVGLHRFGNRGIVRVLLNGEEVGGPYNCHLPRPASGWKTPSLGTHELRGGEHRLRIEVLDRHDDVPTAWIALGGLLIRPGDEASVEPPSEATWTPEQWSRLMEEHPGAAGSVLTTARFRDPERLDYRLLDESLAERFGPRWSEHLSWITEEHLQRIADPHSEFLSDHHHWDRSHGPPR